MGSFYTGRVELVACDECDECDECGGSRLCRGDLAPSLRGRIALEPVGVVNDGPARVRKYKRRGCQSPPLVTNRLYVL